MNLRQFYALKSSFNKKKIIVMALLTPIIGSALCSVYLQMPFKNKHLIIYQENERNNYIVNQLGPLDDYRPTFYLPNCLLQMAYNEIKPKININFKREFLKTEDGGMISLDWAVRPIDTEETRLIVILHGLTGGSESSYIREIVQGLLEYENNKIVVVQYRGINDSPLLTPKSFHAGDTTDIHFALNYLRKEYGHLACYTIGTSMGANIMVKLFSQDHSFDDYIKGFISISNPFDILTLEQRNRGNVVDYFLRRRQQSYIKRHYEVLKTLGHIEIEKIFKIKRHREFDEIYTIKMFNFENVHEYYSKVSSHLDVDKINIPSFFVNAMNDKLSPYDTLDLDLFKNNPNTILLVTENGGHVCWFTGFFYPKRWFIPKMCKFIELNEELRIGKNVFITPNTL